MIDPSSRKSFNSRESAAAFASIDAAQDRERIYRIACRRFATGITTDEISNLFGKPPNAVSGRLTELKREGRLVATDRRRKTRTGRYARVYVAVSK